MAGCPRTIPKRFLCRLALTSVVMFLVTWLGKETSQNFLEYQPWNSRNYGNMIRERSCVTWQGGKQTVLLRNCDNDRNATVSSPNPLVVHGIQGVPNEDGTVQFGNITIFRAVLNETSLRETVSRIVQLQTVAPAWQRNVLRFVTAASGIHEHYFLTEIARVDLSGSGGSDWAIAGLKQWMHYLYLAGVEHIYICYRYQKYADNMYLHLRKYILLNLATIIPWNFNTVGSKVAGDPGNRVPCYNYFRSRKSGKKSQWQLTLDRSEFPFCPGDQQPGFLRRYLTRFTGHPANADVGAIQIRTYGLLGKGGATQGTLIERNNRITVTAMDGTEKTLYRPPFTVENRINFVYLRYGRTEWARDSDIRILHYLHDSNDTDSNLTVTEEFNEVTEFMAKAVRMSLLTFNEDSAVRAGAGQ